MKKIGLIILVILVIIIASFLINNYKKDIPNYNIYSRFGKIINTPISTPSIIPSPSPSPTPKPLTLSEMNSLYGPCVRLSVLMYHHVQTKESAIANKQTSLSVNTDIFKEQMQYLKDNGYKVVSMQDLVNYFNNGIQIPAKSILLTFDDGYEDFYTDAFPILESFNFTATVFIPTGLMNNGGYLSWDQINQMNSKILFANHTWSHKNMGVAVDIIQKEINTADNQLREKGLNLLKVFSYPYGIDSIQAEKYLLSLNYSLAFSTKSGNILCKQKNLDLPRIRIGNTSLSFYGF